MKKYFGLIAMLVVCLLAVMSVSAADTTVYLNDGGTGDGSSASSPLGDIVEAINKVANGLSIFTGSVGGLIIFALIIAIPVLSPLLAPGAAVQSILGTLIGTLIANGNVPVSLALPALFAISVVDACDFVPVAASLGEADPDTARVATPAMLFSRFVTAPIAVLVGVVAGIGLFK